VTRYPAGPAASPGFLLWRVTLRWQREVARALKPLGLTHVQFVLLASTSWLNGQGQTPTQQAIAAHADTDVKMTSEILRKLEDKGLVVQRMDARDRRARAIEVTETGTALAQQAITVVEQVDADFFRRAPDSLTPTLQALAGLAGD
jgi:DNA-binding MarR family transcriptional regulator